jgi:hypothetical protein
MIALGSLSRALFFTIGAETPYARAMKKHAGIALAAMGFLTSIGCDKKEDPKGDPAAASASAPAAQPTGAAAAPGTAGGGAAAPGAGGTVTGGPAATIANNDKKVVAGMDGGTSTLNLSNQGGKGSITTNPNGATTIQGQSGKTVVIPPIPVPK